MSPLDDYWIRKFIVRTTDADRMDWVTRVHQELLHIPESSRVQLWISWIRPYWEDRIASLPLMLSNGESAKMMSWMDSFAPVYEEFISCMCQTPVPAVDLTNVYYNLREYVDAHPVEVARALCHLLPKSVLEMSRTMGAHAKEIYETLKQRDGLSCGVSCIENELIRLGWY
jgi:hypothetical protein